MLINFLCRTKFLLKTTTPTGHLKYTYLQMNDSSMEATEGTWNTNYFSSVTTRDVDRILGSVKALDRCLSLILKSYRYLFKEPPLSIIK